MLFIFCDCAFMCGEMFDNFNQYRSVFVRKSIKKNEISLKGTSDFYRCYEVIDYVTQGWLYNYNLHPVSN